MNPVIIRVGASVLIGAAILLARWWRERNREQPLMYDMSYGKFDGNNTDLCYICLQDLILENFLSLPCKHKYHKKCIHLVFKEVSSQRRCPVCRLTVPKSFVSKNFLI